MKKIIAGFITILLFFTSFGSDVTVNYSPEVKSMRFELYGSAVYQGRLLTLKSEKGGYCININDTKSMELISLTSIINGKGIPNKVLSKVYVPETIITLGGKPYLLVSFIDKKKDENSIHAVELDRDGNMVGSLKLLTTIKIESRSKSGSFRTEVSANKSKLMILANPSYEKKQDESFIVQVFDQELKNIKKMNVKLPYQDENFALEKILLMDNGKSFIVGEHTLERKEKKKGQDASEFVIVSVDIELEKTNDFIVKIPNRNITSIGVELSKDQSQIHCLGFYSDIDKKRKNYGEDTDGIFNLTIDTKTNEIKNKNFHAFTIDFVNKFLGKSERTAKKTEEKDGIPNHYVLKNICPQKDGSFWAIFEYFRIYEICNTDMKGNVHCTTYYNYGSLITCKVTPEGEIEKLGYMYKDQVFHDKSGFSSFTLVTKDDNISILYNDNVQNIQGVSAIGMGLITKNIALFKAELQENGMFKKEIVKKYEDDRRIFYPLHAIEIDPSNYISPYFYIPKGGPCACFSVFLNPKVGLVQLEIK